MLAAANRETFREFGVRFQAALHELHPLVVCVFFYLSSAAAAVGTLGAGHKLTLGMYAKNLAVLTGVFLVAIMLAHAIHAAYVMTFVRPRHLTREIVGDLRRRFFTAERMAAALLIFMLMPLFMTAFTSIKTMIPEIHPFAWDPAFAEWDRWLHGGSHPWELLQPLIGYPLVSSALNVVYNLWFYVFYFVLLWQTLSLRDRPLRLQFLVSMVLVWALLGSLGATLLSSAGPAFYGRVTGLEDPFLPLMSYLAMADQSYPVWALDVQEALWTTHRLGETGPGSGISAMPSMHVASSVVLALLGWRIGRLAGIALTAFAAVILVGSVHLGWHYAIDGYVSIPAAWAIWVVVGRALARRPIPAAPEIPMSAALSVPAPR